MPRQPIIIIGASIAGLTLGRCLKQRGIAAVIYEKASADPRNNYGITLHSYAYQGLLVRLGIDEQSFHRQTAVDGVNVVGKLAQPATAEPSGNTIIKNFSAHRGKLDAFLSQGLDVRYKHELKKVRLRKDRVGLSFRNGEIINPSFLVGADGVHSHIRIFVLPHVHLKVLPCVAFNGKRSVNRNRFETDFAPFFKHFNVIKTRKKDVLLQVAINKVEDDKVDLTYTHSRLPHEDDALNKPNRPNASATDIPAAFFTEVAALGELEKPFATVFDIEKLKLDRLLHRLMRSVQVSSTDLGRLADHGIVMIGDSVHAQPILGGQGANEAMVDGIDLADLIAENAANPTRAIPHFYELRRQKWEDGVAASETMLFKMHSTSLTKTML